MLKTPIDDLKPASAARRYSTGSVQEAAVHDAGDVFLVQSDKRRTSK
jgi:hypothetical protein